MFLSKIARTDLYQLDEFFGVVDSFLIFNECWSLHPPHMLIFPTFLFTFAGGVSLFPLVCAVEFNFAANNSRPFSINIITKHQNKF